MIILGDLHKEKKREIFHVKRLKADIGLIFFFQVNDFYIYLNLSTIRIKIISKIIQRFFILHSHNAYVHKVRPSYSDQFRFACLNRTQPSLTTSYPT